MQLLAEEEINQVAGGIYAETVGDLFNGFDFPPVEGPVEGDPSQL